MRGLGFIIGFIIDFRGLGFRGVEVLLSGLSSSLKHQCYSPEFLTRVPDKSRSQKSTPKNRSNSWFLGFFCRVDGIWYVETLTLNPLMVFRLLS